MNGLQSLVPAFKKANKPRKKARVPKYGSGGAPATSYVSNMPAFAEQPMRDLVQTTSDMIQQPNVPYTGDRLAQFTDLQEKGFQGVNNLGPSAQSTAAGTLAQTTGDKALATTYDPSTMTSTLPGGPQQTSTQSFTGAGTADKYMNPYMQGVVDIGKREATRQDDIARTQRNAAAVNAGAFGGSRQGIVEAEANRNLQQRLGDIQQQGSDAAFRAAQAQFNQEQQTGLESQKANQGAGLTFNAQDLERQKADEASRQFGADLGMRGLNAANTSASTLGGIGSDIYGQNLKTTGAQLAAGTAEQEQVQKGLDQQYGDFKEQENDPYRKLSFMSDILHGTQGAVKTSFDTPAQPSNLQTLAGLGSIFAGLSKAEGGSVKKLSAIDRGLARVAPDSDFADGGIVGYEKGGKTTKEDFMPDEWRGDDSAATTFGAITVPSKAVGATRRAIQDAKILANYGTDAQSVIKPVGRFGKAAGAVGRVAAPVGIGLTALDTYATPTEQYDKRFGFEGREPSFVGDLGVRSLGAASDLGNTLTGGLAGKYLFRDMEQEKAPQAGPTKAAAEKKDVIDLADLSAKAAQSSGGGGGGGGLMRIPVPKALTLEEVKALNKEGGVDLSTLKTEGKQGIEQVGAARKADAEASAAGLEELYNAQGKLGAEREAKLNARMAEMPEREKRNERDALINAGLAILTAPPGGKGWRGAIAPIAGGAREGTRLYALADKELRAEKAKLDDSLDLLADARRQEDLARGKDKLAAKDRVRTLTTDTLEKSNDFVQRFGLEDFKLKKGDVDAVLKSREEQKKAELQAGIHTASNAAMLSAANTRASASSSSRFAGMKPDQMERAINGLTDDLMKANLGMSLEEARTHAREYVRRELQGQGVPPSSAGFGGFTVTK
jgi:hypothetical protein